MNHTLTETHIPHVNRNTYSIGKHVIIRSWQLASDNTALKHGNTRRKFTYLSQNLNSFLIAPPIRILKINSVSIPNHFN